MDTRNSRNQIWIGLVIIAIGVLALVNNLVSPVLMSWAWIITLGASAVICAWQYSRHPEIGTAIVGPNKEVVTQYRLYAAITAT